MKRFDNKTAIVTGGASGIGEACVRRLVNEGATVVIADFSHERALKLEKKLQDEGANVKAVFFSAVELNSCKTLIDFVVKEYKHIDLLVNNVGGNDLSRDLNIADMDISYFDELFHLNLRCCMYLTQLCIPHMEKQGGGVFVNIASISGITADFRGTLYGASKAGVINFTKYVATQMGEKNIRCNAIAPGLVLSPSAIKYLPDNIRELFLKESATNYLGEPEDIASIVAFLGSEDSRYVTGQTIVADGGLSIHNPTVFDMIDLFKKHDQERH